MDRDASFHDAKRLYLESYGDPMVTNTYLKIALALLALVCVALALIDLRTIRTFDNFRPLVTRIDDLGRARAPATPSRTTLRNPSTSWTERSRAAFSMLTARTTSFGNSSPILRPRKS